MHGGQQVSLECALYVVATPIGNLRDISLRALDVLASVDVIAAEDTRNTTHLLTHYGIASNRLIALHEHNERQAATQILRLLGEGQSVALVTDAGTPAISDPGALLVQAARTGGYRIIPIPGANAALTAFSASGSGSPHFLFYGFLPSKAAARRRELKILAALPYPVVIYEAPHRILECVEDMNSILGTERSIVIARELTKLFEEIHTCPLDQAAAWLNANPNRQRGEFVLLVSGAAAKAEEAHTESRRILQILLAEVPLKQAVQLAAQITGGSRNQLYQEALQSKQAAT